MHPFKLDKIKPTRLWHLTGRRHFWGALKARFNTVPHNYLPKSRQDAATLIGIALTAATGFLYSYGRFSPDAKVPNKECRPDGRPPPPCPRTYPCD